MAASASGGRDWYAALPLPWRTDSLGYVLRSIGATALALGLGLYLQLDSPFSAASTVLLLINPVQGRWSARAGGAPWVPWSARSLPSS